MKPSCKRFQEYMIESFHGEPLSPAQKKALNDHLAECPFCKTFKEEIARLLEGISPDPLPSLPETFFEEMRENILETLAPRVPSPPFWKRLLVKFRSFIRQQSFWIPAISGACGLLLGFAIAAAWMETRSSLPQRFSPPPTQMASSQDTATLQNRFTEDVSAYETLEDFPNTIELLDTLNEQEIQVFLSTWSKELPEPLFEEPFEETG